MSAAGAGAVERSIKMVVRPAPAACGTFGRAEYCVFVCVCENVFVFATRNVA